METSDLRDLPGLYGYKVDNQGNIYSGWVTGQNPFVDYDRLKKLTPVPVAHGYLKVTLRPETGKKKQMLVHRAVLLAFRGDPGENMVASHLNGNRTDNRLENLVWETQRDNLARKFEHGTHDSGYLNSRASIDQEQLGRVRSMLADGIACTEIGRRLNISALLVSRIKRKERYARV